MRAWWDAKENRTHKTKVVRLDVSAGAAERFAARGCHG